MSFNNISLDYLASGTSVTPVNPEIPSVISLSRNYPNPFNPTTTIEFGIPDNNFVRVEVYDAIGKRVSTLVNDQLAAGRHQAIFDARGLASGVYFYRLHVGNQIFTEKKLLVK